MPAPARRSPFRPIASFSTRCARRPENRLGPVLAVAMDGVDPPHLFRLFDRLDIEIDDNRLVVAAHQHAFQGLLAGSVDLLMRHIGRYKDEIARSGLRDIFEMLAPTHARPPFQDINDAFERAVMMRAGFGIGVDMDRAGPDLLRADAGEIDRRRAIHPGGLGRVGVELIAGDHLDAVGLPVDPFWLLAHRGRPKRRASARYGVSASIFTRSSRRYRPATPDR